ncbi:hypothetical protein QLX08_009146 [Tetragonisca angustula]|uniref:Uncharacterized protein n=1 Tax=Tetragonisca angustula TaxID=166442 RepID=A0AAW0ZIT1_9HYME
MTNRTTPPSFHEERSVFFFSNIKKKERCYSRLNDQEIAQTAIHLFLGLAGTTIFLPLDLDLFVNWICPVNCGSTSE